MLQARQQREGCWTRPACARWRRLFCNPAKGLCSARHSIDWRRHSQAEKWSEMHPNAASRAPLSAGLNSCRRARVQYTVWLSNSRDRNLQAAAAPRARAVATPDDNCWARRRTAKAGAAASIRSLSRQPLLCAPSPTLVPTASSRSRLSCSTHIRARLIGRAGALNIAGPG